MELSSPVLSGLIRKRQELVVDLAAAQVYTRQVAASIEAMDATIRLFSPTINLATAWVRPVRHSGNPARETMRNVLEVMRQADSPLSYNDVALATMRASGADTENRALVEVIRRREGGRALGGWCCRKL